MAHCPGQDMRYWKPEDIFDVRCPHCGNILEFWKDEPSRVCSSCKNEVRNPRINLGCAKWCAFGNQCLGVTLLHPNDAKGTNKNKARWSASGNHSTNVESEALITQ